MRSLLFPRLAGGFVDRLAGRDPGDSHRASSKHPIRPGTLPPRVGRIEESRNRGIENREPMTPGYVTAALYPLSYGPLSPHWH